MRAARSARRTTASRGSSLIAAPRTRTGASPRPGPRRPARTSRRRRRSPLLRSASPRGAGPSRTRCRPRRPRRPSRQWRATRWWSRPASRRTSQPRPLALQVGDAAVDLRAAPFEGGADAILYCCNVHADVTLPPPPWEFVVAEPPNEHADTANDLDAAESGGGGSEKFRVRPFCSEERAPVDAHVDTPRIARNRSPLTSRAARCASVSASAAMARSEEHTSEL